MTALFLALLPGCATLDSAHTPIPRPRLEPTAETVALQSEPEFDAERQRLALRGPVLREPFGADAGGILYRARLVGSRSREGPEHFELFLMTRRAGSAPEFEIARDEERIRLAMARVLPQKECSGDECGFSGHFQIGLTREYLEAHLRGGFRLTLQGAGDPLEIVVPASYVRGFMSRMQLEWASRREGVAASDERKTLSYCWAKYGDDDRTLDFCRQQTRASYERLSSVMERAHRESSTPESRLVMRCTNRHTSPFGVDWMMVEHCYRKIRGTQRVGPASR